MRKLDFIVFGLARSGTSALTHLLCANKNIFCGMEFFPPRVDHSKLAMPGAFESRAKSIQKGGQKLPPHIEKSLQALAGKEAAQIQAYGSKLPLYTHYLDRVMAEIESEKAIMCYRDPRACARSYDRRAALPNDPWPAGRVGFFAAVEMMHAFKVLAKTKHLDVLVVPQALMARDWRTTADTLFDYLLPGKEVEIDADAIAGLEQRREARQKLKEVVLSDEDEKLHEVLDQAGVSAALESDTAYMLRDRIDVIRAAADKLPEDHVAFCADLAAKHSNPKVAKQFEAWRVHANAS